MPAKIPSNVIGIDVGGTNTDAVILRNDQVVAWYKTPTTSDIQAGVEHAIREVIRRGEMAPSQVSSVKIGTTVVLEQNKSKLDKVAVIRLCGPYSRRSPPFVGFPVGLCDLMEGHYGYVDGGYQVDGRVVRTLRHEQLKEQAAIIKSQSIKSLVVVGVYSPSNPEQELEAASVLVSELGAGYDVSCSHKVGRLGFLERENASILNASLRRFARHVIAGFKIAAQKLGKCSLHITLNDGTLSKASEAAEHPATDLILSNDRTDRLVQSHAKASGLAEINRAVEEAIDLVKTKPGDVRAILVGGGSIIISDEIAGVGELIRPEYLEVANAVGAAIGKISGSVDMVVVPTENSTMDAQIEEAKAVAADRCIAAGGNEDTLEVVEIETIPISYTSQMSMKILERMT
ncbi:hydantoinase/oxoprolinase [Colletotrichum graminicola]|nr:hydantoinase/oxoprolinase [Colletotrichum graminicola]